MRFCGERQKLSFARQYLRAIFILIQFPVSDGESLLLSTPSESEQERKEVEEDLVWYAVISSLSNNRLTFQLRY